MPSVRVLPNGRYRVQWRDAAGNWRSPVPSQSFATKTMARDYGLDREAEVRSGTARDPNAGRMLLKDWVTEWLDNRVAEQRTLNRIRGHMRNHVLQPVGDVKALGLLRLDQLDEMALQSWVKRLQAQGLAPATVDGIYKTLGSALRAAVRARKILYDPTTGVRLPTIPPPSDFYWERDEITALRQHLTDPRDLALFELLIGTGMRWSEAIGLHAPRWQPLRRRVSVVEVITEDQGFALKLYPKGGKRRDLPALSNELLEAMAAHLAINEPVDCGLDHGRDTCTGLVFHQNGHPISRGWWPRKILDPAIEAAEVRRGTPHDLRHTYASWLALDGVSMRVIQSLLGHVSIRTTERYSHLSPATLDDPMLVASLKGQTASDRDAKRDAHSERPRTSDG